MMTRNWKQAIWLVIALFILLGGTVLFFAGCGTMVGKLGERGADERAVPYQGVRTDWQVLASTRETWRDTGGAPAFLDPIFFLSIPFDSLYGTCELPWVLTEKK